MPSESLVMVVFGGLHSIITALLSASATYAVLRWRVQSVEHALFGNGKPGLIEEFNRMRLECAKQHGKCVDHG